MLKYLSVVALEFVDVWILQISPANPHHFWANKVTMFLFASIKTLINRSWLGGSVDDTRRSNEYTTNGTTK